MTLCEKHEGYDLMPDMCPLCVIAGLQAKIERMKEERELIQHDLIELGGIIADSQAFYKARAVAWKQCAKRYMYKSAACWWGWIGDDEFVSCGKNDNEEVIKKAPPDWHKWAEEWRKRSENR